MFYRVFYRVQKRSKPSNGLDKCEGRLQRRLKKPRGKPLTAGAWSSRTNVNLKPQTRRQGPDHVTDFLTFAVRGK